jgi:hypothetical protein
MRSHPLLALATIVILISVASAATRVTDLSARTALPARVTTTVHHSQTPSHASASHAARPDVSPKTPLLSATSTARFVALATNPVPLGIATSVIVVPRVLTHLAGAPAPVSPIFQALRDCESGGNYAADTGNGYYGAYQFAASTWWSIGYSGLPNDAPPHVQDQAAVRLYDLSGWRAWPTCSVRIGLVS